MTIKIVFPDDWDPVFLSRLTPSIPLDQELSQSCVNRAHATLGVFASLARTSSLAWKQLSGPISISVQRKTKFPFVRLWRPLNKTMQRCCVDHKGFHKGEVCSRLAWLCTSSFKMFYTAEDKCSEWLINLPEVHEQQEKSRIGIFFLL